jgi:membrane fusion protein, multidrug efflux system
MRGKLNSTHNFLKAELCLFCLLIMVLPGCNSTSATSGDDPPSTKKGGKKGKGGGGGGPAPVVAAKVIEKTVPIEVSAVGNVEAYSTINVVPQISGQLTEIYFHEGDFVQKGQKLFSIDPSQLEAQVAQAEANLARDEALLSQAEANLAKDSAGEKYARDQAVRYAKLFAEGIVSKEQGDQLTSTADSLAQGVRADKAAGDSLRAQMRADQAAIRNLKVQLAFTTISSPIDGRTGNLTVKPGNVVNANTSSLMSITQVQPIYATFSVPETHLSAIRRYMAQGKLAVQATPQDGSTNKAAQGVLTFVDNNVDSATGTIKLKGTFPNSDRQLWPGEYVNVVLRMAVRQNALVVPNQAVQTGQDGTYVYVVKDDQTVEMRPVTAGLRVDQDLVIDKGLEAGETVVTEGQLRLAPGSRVQIGGPNGPGGNRQGGRGGGRKGGKGGDGGRATGAADDPGDAKGAEGKRQSPAKE